MTRGLPADPAPSFVPPLVSSAPLPAPAKTSSHNDSWFARRRDFGFLSAFIRVAPPPRPGPGQTFLPRDSTSPQGSPSDSGLGSSIPPRIASPSPPSLIRPPKAQPPSLYPPPTSESVPPPDGGRNGAFTTPSIKGGELVSFGAAGLIRNLR